MTPVSHVERVEASRVELLDGSVVLVTSCVHVCHGSGYTDEIRWFEVVRLVGPEKGARTLIDMAGFALGPVPLADPDVAARTAGALVRHVSHPWN